MDIVVGQSREGVSEMLQHIIIKKEKVLDFLTCLWWINPQDLMKCIPDHNGSKGGEMLWPWQWFLNEVPNDWRTVNVVPLFKKCKMAI